MTEAHLCACGCKQETKVADRTRPEYGQIKGQPNKFLHGHHARGNTYRLGDFRPGSRPDNIVRMSGENNPRWNGGDRHSPEARREYSRWYRKQFPEKRSEFEARRRARKQNTQVESIDYNFVAERDNWMCYLCEEMVRRTDKSFDHVIPLVHGGTHTYDNIKLTHLVCNIQKGTKLGYE